MRSTVETTTLAQLPAVATKTEVAAFLGVSVRTVDRLRENGELQTVLVGSRSVRITVSSVARYLERQVGGAAAPPEAEPETDPFAIPLLEELRTAKLSGQRAEVEAAA